MTGAGRRAAIAASAVTVAAIVWTASSFRTIPEDTLGVRDGLVAGRPTLVGPGHVFVPFGLDRLATYPAGIVETDLGDGVVWTTREGATIPFRATVVWRIAPSAIDTLHRAAGGGDPAREVVPPAVARALASLAERDDGPDVGTRDFRDRARGEIARALRADGIDLVGLADVRDLPSGASPVPRAAVPDRDVLVIGLDGADWDLIDPLLDRGALPNLRRLVEAGVRARLRTVQPILSPVVWTSAATGKTPDKHGVYDFLARTEDGRTVPVTRTLWRARPFWSVLGDAGVDVAVTAWWATWPAEPVRGVLATDRISFQLFGEILEDDDPEAAFGKTWPPGLWDDLRPLRVEPDAIDDDALRSYVDLEALGTPDDDDRERLDALRTIVASGRTYEAIATRFLDERPSGIHVVYHEATDTVAHLFMPFRPPAVVDADSGRARAFGDAVDAAYREADALIGRLLSRIDDGWNVVVLSDHGFKHGANRPTTDSRTDRAAAADWHDRFGVLVLYGPDVPRGVEVADASILDVVPTLLALYGLPVPDDLDGRVLEEALEPTFLADHPVTRTGTYELPDIRPAEAIASERDAAMIERLRSLGYIGGVSEDTGATGGAEAYAQDGARALNHRGIALLAGGDRDGAMEAFREALAAGGGVGSLVNIARLQLASKDTPAARATLDDIARAAPDFRQLPALRGWLADLEGDPSAARAALEEAVRLDPSDSRSWTRLGHLDESAGDPARALARYREAVRVDPENAEAHNYLGNVLRRQGRLDEAEAAYRASMDADPRYPGAYNNLGLVLQARGRPDEAIALYRRGLLQVPDSALLRSSLAGALLGKGDAAAAEAEARRAVDAEPGFAEAHNNLGIALAEQGRIPEAADAFEDAVRLDPAGADAWFNLGRIRLLRADREGALAAFARASDLRPDHFEAAVGAGETARALGRLEVARRYLERALALRPDVERVRARLEELGGRS